MLPFLAQRFDLAHADLAAHALGDVSSSLVRPLFGLLFGTAARGVAALVGVLVAARGQLPVASPARARADHGLRRGSQHRRLSPGGAKLASCGGQRRASGMLPLQRRREHQLHARAHRRTPVVVWLGLNGTLVAALPVLLTGWRSSSCFPYLRDLRPTAASRAVAGGGPPRAMAVLIGVILLRTTTWFGLITFVPLWVVSLGGIRRTDGNRLLSLHARGRGGRRTRVRAGRRPDRPPSHTARDDRGAAAAGAHLRVRRRCPGRDRA